MTSMNIALREIQRADAQEIALLLKDGRVALGTTTIPSGYGLHDADRWIESLATSVANRIDHAIAAEGSGKLIGVISCSTLDMDTAPGNVAYWVGQDYWGRGVATRALALLLLDPAVRQRHAVLEGRHLESNPASGRVLEKNGFQVVGHEMKPWRGGALVKLIKYSRGIEPP